MTPKKTIAVYESDEVLRNTLAEYITDLREYEKDFPEELRAVPVESLDELKGLNPDVVITNAGYSGERVRNLLDYMKENNINFNIIVYTGMTNRESLKNLNEIASERGFAVSLVKKPEYESLIEAIKSYVK